MNATAAETFVDYAGSDPLARGLVSGLVIAGLDLLGASPPSTPSSSCCTSTSRSPDRRAMAASNPRHSP